MTSLHLRKIVEEEIGLVLRQLLAGPRTGRDRDRARAEDFPAGDVMSGVADDIDRRGREFMAVFLRARWRAKAPSSLRSW